MPLPGTTPVFAFFLEGGGGEVANDDGMDTVMGVVVGCASSSPVAPVSWVESCCCEIGVVGC